MLIHQGKVLKDATTLEENKVAENSFIVIMLSKTKVSSSGASTTSVVPSSTGINHLAGAEAVISHLVVKNFGIPCAHAPTLSPLSLSMSLCPKSAAEEIGYTFLPCVLAGLSNAPQYMVNKSESLERGCILATDVDSVILPLDTCGGDGALAFASLKRNKVPIITVEENETVLNDSADKLGIEAEDYFYNLPYNTGYQIFVLRLRKTRDEIIKCTLYICRYIF